MPDFRGPYRELRNYLAGQHLGATRDESLFDEVIKALLCKGALDDRLGYDRDRADGVAYRATWSEVVARMPRLFSKRDRLALADSDLESLDHILRDVDVHSPHGDPFGDLFEIFVGSVARGQEGQFFTPANACALLVELINPQPGERVLDPACGAAGFLASAARHMVANGLSPSAAGRSLIGIDKDARLARLAGLRLALLTGQEPSVHCGDSLSWRSTQDFPSFEQISGADVILTNPPFGSKIVALAPTVRREFDLAHKWKLNSQLGRYVKTREVLSSVSPQVAFLEQCLRLLRPGGRLGIVVPESLVSNARHQYVMQYLRDHADLHAVIGMPESLFKTTGSGGTHTKTCLILAQVRGAHKRSISIFMAEAKWCGNDSRGRRTARDDLPEIAKRFRMPADARPNDHLGYDVPGTAIRGNILTPRYYDPSVEQALSQLAATHQLIPVRQLVDDGVLEIRSGNEIGKEAYASGTVPFVRTSDLSNWEIKLDPKHGVADELYEALAPKQDVRAGDILMVRDGTYLIGTCAFVTEYDERILYQSHILKLRVLKPDILSPYLLLAVLSSAPVKKQIAAKRFTMDIIDSIGSRVNEVVLPIPKDDEMRRQVTEKVARVIRDRVEARELARQACLDVANHLDPDDIDLDATA